MAKQEKHVFHAKDADRSKDRSEAKTVFRAKDSLSSSKTQQAKEATESKRAAPVPRSAAVKSDKQPERAKNQDDTRRAEVSASRQRTVQPPAKQESTAATKQEKSLSAQAPSKGRTIRRSGQTVVRNMQPSQPPRERELSASSKSPVSHTKQPPQKKPPVHPAQMAAVRQNGKRKKKNGRHPFVIAATLVLLLAGTAAVAVFNQDRLPSSSQTGEASGSASGFPVQVGDRQVDARPERIVSLSPMLTQALLSLPGHEVLCGVTEYCNTGREELPTVGTPLLPRADKIKELGAEYVLCQTPIPDGVARSIEQDGARIIQMAPAKDTESLRELYAQLGALLLGDETGRPLGASVIDRLQDSLARCSQITKGEKTALLLPDLSGMAATEDAAEWALLGQVFRHPAPDASDWMADAAELSDEDEANDLEPIRRADPDLLFLPSDIPPELLNEKLGDLRAVQQGAVVWYDRQTAENLSPMFLMDIVRGVRLVCPQEFETIVSEET